jgi:hypothetical protein
VPSVPAKKKQKRKLSKKEHRRKLEQGLDNGGHHKREKHKG